MKLSTDDYIGICFAWLLPVVLFIVLLLASCTTRPLAPAASAPAFRGVGWGGVVTNLNADTITCSTNEIAHCRMNYQKVDDKWYVWYERGTNATLIAVLPAEEPGKRRLLVWIKSAMKVGAFVAGALLGWTIMDWIFGLLKLKRRRP